MAAAPKPPRAMPASWSAATPESTAAPRAAAAGGVSGPRDRIEPRGVPSFGSTATQIPFGSVPQARTGDRAGWRWSKRRWRRGTAAVASAGGIGISCTTAGFPLFRTAFQPWPPPGATSSISFGFGSDSGIQRCMVPLRNVAYVIVQPCIDVKDASCVEVCPVDCIHSDDAANMYYIDPDECIDCGACVDPCPVDAIFPEDEVPEQWRNFIQINADYFKNR